MRAGVRSVHATTPTREMCAVRGILSSPRTMTQEENAQGCSMLFQRMGALTLLCAISEASQRIVTYLNQCSFQQEPDLHCTIGDSNCTNSTTATEKCACAAAAVVVSVELQRDRRLEHFAILSLLHCNQGVRSFCQNLERRVHIFLLSSIRKVDTTNLCFFIVCEYRFLHQSLLRHSYMVCVVFFSTFKDGTEAFLLALFEASLALPRSCASLLLPYGFPRDCLFLRRSKF